MGFRDDHDAALKRAEALEAALRKSQRALDEKEDEIAALKAGLTAERNDGKRDRRSRPADSKGTRFLPTVGILSIVLAFVGLGLCVSMILNWSTYIRETTATMKANGRAETTDAMIAFNAGVGAWFAIQSVGLLVLGIGQSSGRRWATWASLLWSIMALVFIVVDVMGTTLIEGKGVGWVSMGINSIYPAFLLVFHSCLKPA